MDKTFLVESDITAGKNFIKLLDDKQFNVHSALWINNPDQGYWRLLIATSLVDDEGQRFAYSKIQNILLSSIKSSGISLSDISVISPRNPLIQVLSKAIKTGKSINVIRFSKNTINNTYIEDAVIYRLQ